MEFICVLRYKLNRQFVISYFNNAKCKYYTSALLIEDTFSPVGYSKNPAKGSNQTPIPKSVTAKDNELVFGTELNLNIVLIPREDRHFSVGACIT